ncbi:MAG: methylmalonyl-CoA epimerase [Erythrobacter sp.]|nr:methylmalonyl-CoA epimerase [Erythrobacter sp.]
MKLGRMNHVGYAVPDMNAAVAHYRDVMGATSISDPILLEESGLKVVFVDTPTDTGMNGTQIELIEETRPGTAISAFLEKNPLGGQHHVCFEVPDIEQARAEFEALGKRILGPTRIGAHGTPIFFVHPKDMQGMLTEIMETPREGAHWSN